MDIRKYMRAYYRRRKHKRITAGLCVVCGQPQDRDGTSTCTTCSRKRYSVEKARQRKNKRQGLCIRCTNKAQPDLSLCVKCAQKCHKRHMDNKVVYRAHRHEQRTKLKREVFEAYGGVKCNCPGCKVTEVAFLTMDHIDGGGMKDRIKGRRGYRLYLYLKQQGYPKGYQVLCFNCNAGRAINGGVCPKHGQSH